MNGLELKPCPKCRNDVNVRIEIGQSRFKHCTLARFVCAKCGFAGASETTVPEAVAAWNRCAKTEGEETK